MKSTACVLCLGLALAPSTLADISVTSLTGSVKVDGFAGAPGFPRESYDFLDSLTALGQSLSFTGSAVSGAANAASDASASTRARSNGFDVALTGNAVARKGPGDSGSLANGQTDLVVEFTLTEAGPLWVGGRGAGTFGTARSPFADVRVTLLGPGGTALYRYGIHIASSDIEFYLPAAASGSYRLVCESVAYSQDAGGGGFQGGMAFATANFTVATVPAPGTLLSLAGVMGLTARRRRR